MNIIGRVIADDQDQMEHAGSPEPFCCRQQTTSFPSTFAPSLQARSHQSTHALGSVIAHIRQASKQTHLMSGRADSMTSFLPSLRIKRSDLIFFVRPSESRHCWEGLAGEEMPSSQSRNQLAGNEGKDYGIGETTIGCQPR